jgi:integrase
VQRFVNDLAQRYAPNTVRTYYALLRAIFNGAVNGDLIARTPCRGIKLPAARSKPPRSVTVDDIHRLAEAVGVEYREMVHLAAELGLRFGECAGLQVGDLDFFRRAVTVRRTVAEVRGAVVIGEPKTAAGIRTVAVSAPLMAELAESLRRSPNFVQRVWLPALERVGLASPRLTFHALRHAAATSWVAAGVDIRTAQHRLGHSTPRLVLALYAHATTDADREAAEKAGALLFGRQKDDGRLQPGTRAPWTRHESSPAQRRAPRARRSPAQTAEPGVGIEPTTSSLQEKCSAN